jgi:hypothetical protein
MQPMIVLGILNLLLIVIVGAFNWFSHFKIVGNDLFHLNADVKKIIEKQEVISEKVVSLATDLAFVRGNCALNTCKKSFKKSKKISNKV